MKVWSSRDGWVEKPSSPQMEDAWFRLPSGGSGAVARWNFTDAGSSLTDIENSIVLAPYSTYDNVQPGVFRGVKCVQTTKTGFLEGASELLRIFGDVTLEMIWLRQNSVSAGSQPYGVVLFNYYGSAALTQTNNRLYSIGIADYGSTLIWRHQHGVQVSDDYTVGYAAGLNRPTYVAGTRLGTVVSIYSDGVLLGSSDLLDLPDGGDSPDHTLMVGGTRYVDAIPGSTNASFFSGAITARAMPASEIYSRYQATTANFYR